MTPEPAPPLPAPVPHRRPRLGVWASMILVLLAALPIARVANAIRTQREAIAAVRAAGGGIRFDFENQPMPFSLTGPGGNRTEPAAPAWVRRWLGDELFQEVEGVWFMSTASPSILARVAPFEQLKVLSLADPPDAGDGSLHLRGLRRLETLRLAEAWLTDPILGEVAELSSLQTLQLDSAAATDAGFARLAALSGLRDLRITWCRNLTDEGTARLLAGLPALRQLDLGCSGERGFARTVASLAEHCPNLETLSLRGDGLRDDDLAAIGRLGKLGSLHLDSFRLTDAGLAHLRGLARLHTLRVLSPEVTDAGLAHLAGLWALQSIDIPAARSTDVGLARLAGLPNLYMLILGPSPGVTDAGLAAWHRHPMICSLRLRTNATTPAGIAALRAAVPSLFDVAIESIPVPVPPR